MMKRLMATMLVIAAVSLGSGLLSPALASARGCEDSFMMFRPWYFGLVNDDENCSFKTIVVPEDGQDAPAGSVTLTVFVWTVILNILNILLILVGYLALGVLIYGGYIYALSRGDPTKIAAGKKTVVAAVVGLIICILASLIATTIVLILTEATGGGA